MLLGAFKKEHIKRVLNGLWLFLIYLIFTGKKNTIFIKAAINENHRFNSGHEKSAADFSTWN